MPEWGLKIVCVFVGGMIGFLAACLCAMARCNDCEKIGRIWRGGKG